MQHVQALPALPDTEQSTRRRKSTRNRRPPPSLTRRIDFEWKWFIVSLESLPETQYGPDEEFSVWTAVLEKGCNGYKQWLDIGGLWTLTREGSRFSVVLNRKSRKGFWDDLEAWWVTKMHFAPSRNFDPADHNPQLCTSENLGTPLFVLAFLGHAVSGETFE